MQPDSRRLPTDMLAAAQSIEAYLQNKQLVDIQHNDLLRSAVYFKFVIIGEAMAQLRSLDIPTAQRISEYARIINFRNQIIHGYARIDDEITWRIVQAKLPVLIHDLSVLLSPPIPPDPTGPP